jgi:hypothetical protein
MRRLPTPLLLTLALLGHAAAASAATEYTITRTGGMGKRAIHERVIAEDGRIRATSDVEEGPILFDGVLWLEGSPVIALNSQNQTWYELDDPFALSSYYLYPLLSPRGIADVKVELQEQVGATDGKRRYSVRLHYLVRGGGGVEVTCDATLEVTTTDAIDRRLWAGRFLPKTRYPEVDERLAGVEKIIRGFPLHLSMTVTRKYAGGDAMTVSATIEVSGIRQMKADPASFVRPSGYQHQKPVIGAPGG